MNESEAVVLLDIAARELVPDEPVPLPALLVAARRGRHRRNRVTFALAAACVALIAGGGAIIHQVAMGRASEPASDQTVDQPTMPAAVGDVVGKWRIVSMAEFEPGSPREWRLTGRVIEPDRYVVTFTDSRWVVWTETAPCYYESGGYELDAGMFSYADPAYGSGSRCPDSEVYDVLGNVWNLLFRAARAEVQGNRLYLVGRDGARYLSLTRGEKDLVDPHQGACFEVGSMSVDCDEPVP